MIEYAIEVFERNDTQIPIQLVHDTDDQEPFDLTPYEAVEFYVKNRGSDDDADAVAKYTTADSSIVITSLLDGRLVVLTDAVSLSIPGRYRHRIDTCAADGSDRVTRMAGPFVIANV